MLTDFTSLRFVYSRLTIAHLMSDEHKHPNGFLLNSGITGLGLELHTDLTFMDALGLDYIFDTVLTASSFDKHRRNPVHYAYMAGN